MNFCAWTEFVENDVKGSQVFAQMPVWRGAHVREPDLDKDGRFITK
jgi:hypothetical protein